MRASLAYHPVVARLRDLLGNPKPGTRGEVCFNSPFQEHFKDPRKADTKHHLYVNPEKGVFFDYKTSMTGSISYLLRLLGAEDDQDGEWLAPPPSADSLATLSAKLASLDCRYVVPRAALPEFYQPVRQDSKVHMYLRRRGLSDEDIGLYRIGEGKGDYNNLVILPSFGADGLCDFWVTRRTEQNRTSMKYKNPPGVPRRLHVGLIEIAKHFGRGEAILCEGVFSAIVAGRSAVCTYGKAVSDEQLDRLWRVGFRALALALDGDVEARTIFDVAERCLRVGFRVRVVCLPRDRDPADLGRAAFSSLLLQAVPIDENALLRARLERLLL